MNRRCLLIIKVRQQKILPEQYKSTTVNNLHCTLTTATLITGNIANRSSTKMTTINTKFSYQQHCFQNGIQNRSNTGFSRVHEGAISLTSIEYENCENLQKTFDMTMLYIYFFCQKRNDRRYFVLRIFYVLRNCLT